MTVIDNPEVTRPVPDPLRSSILDHATVVEIGHFGLRNNEGLWPSYNCLDVLVPTPICPDPLLEDGEFKQFSIAPWVPAFEFAVHGGVQCSLVGLDRDDQKAEVERVFDLAAGKGVEMALLATRFVERVNGSGETGPEWDAPVDLSSAGMTLLGALGALEGFAAATYAGVPTIHMPRSAALILSALGAITWSNGIATTKTGAKVAAGGGYDTDTPPNGQFTLYATGEVYVERSEEIDIQAWVQPGDGSGIGSGENGLADNTSVALAERMYRVGVDCFVAKATGRAWTA
jgi:hypothetical protein